MRATGNAPYNRVHCLLSSTKHTLLVVGGKAGPTRARALSGRATTQVRTAHVPPLVDSGCQSHLTHKLVQTGDEQGYGARRAARSAHRQRPSATGKAHPLSTHCGLPVCRLGGSAAAALHAQAVRERLAALSEERRHTVLQRHAELRALARGIEAIPSLDAEATPEPLAKVRPGGPLIAGRPQALGNR